MALVSQINQGFNFIKNAWVFWCWLPVPVLSIILGFKYKNAGNIDYDFVTYQKII